MSDKNLVIVENEKIFQENNKFYCDNIDAKSIPEGINNFRKTYLIARKAKVKSPWGYSVFLTNFRPIILV